VNVTARKFRKKNPKNTALRIIRTTFQHRARAGRGSFEFK